jgi:hypothetical protein
MPDIPFELAAQAARLIVIATCIAAGLLFAEHHFDTKPRNPWKRRK